MLAIIIIIMTIFIDQISKYGAFINLLDSKPIVIIENFFQLNYVENYGAAWGILKNQRHFLVILTILIFMALAIYIKTNKNLSKLTLISISLIIGGAIGNLIDRIKMGYVIDFLDVNFGDLYDFPVFNFADSFIVIGTFIMLYLILTDRYEKPEEIKQSEW